MEKWTKIALIALAIGGGYLFWRKMEVKKDIEEVRGEELALTQIGHAPAIENVAREEIAEFKGLLDKYGKRLSDVETAYKEKAIEAATSGAPPPTPASLSAGERAIVERTMPADARAAGITPEEWAHPTEQVTIPATPISPTFAYPAWKEAKGNFIAVTPKEAAAGVEKITGIKQTVDWGGSPESRTALLTYNYSKLGAGDPGAFLARVPEAIRATLSPSVALKYAKANPGGIAPGTTPSKAKLYELGVKAHEAGFKSVAGMENALIAQGVQPASAKSIGKAIVTWGVEWAKAKY